MKAIHFVPVGGDAGAPHPVSAKKVVPDWYKKAELDYQDSSNNLQPGLKRCLPFLDGLLSGYVLLTWCDIHVSKNLNGEIVIDWYNTEDVQENHIGERIGLSGHTIPRPAGHLNNHLVWLPQWGWKTPRGYSTLVTHPLNRFDLPFTTTSAVIDSDKFWTSGNIPFFLKDNFEGIIPKGTPFLQIIPFKRKKWLSVFNPALIDPARYLSSVTRNNNRYYKKYRRQKKEYL
ncbi:hypothetical protein EB001_14095 [bacterium]|nr:hypothetical protein [bacterium]